MHTYIGLSCINVTMQLRSYWEFNFNVSVNVSFRACLRHHVVLRHGAMHWGAIHCECLLIASTEHTCATKHHSIPQYVVCAVVKL